MEVKDVRIFVFLEWYRPSCKRVCDLYTPYTMHFKPITQVLSSTSCVAIMLQNPSALNWRQSWASTDFFEYEYRPFEYEYEYEYGQNRTQVRVLRVFCPALIGGDASVKILWHPHWEGCPLNACWRGCEDSVAPILREMPSECVLTSESGFRGSFTIGLWSLAFFLVSIHYAECVLCNSGFVVVVCLKFS